MQRFAEGYQPRHVGSLTSEQRLLLWGIRQWMRSRCHSIAPRSMLHQAFAGFGAQDMAPALCLFMEVAAAAWPDPMQTGLPCIRQPLTPDECLIVDMIDRIARGDEQGFILLVRDFLGPTAIARLKPLAARIAGATDPEVLSAYRGG